MLIIKMDLWKSGRWFVDFLQIPRSFGVLETKGNGENSSSVTAHAQKGQTGDRTAVGYGIGFVSRGSVFIWVVMG